MTKLFVVPNCPLCATAREILLQHNIVFEELDVSTNYGALRSMFKLTRQKLVPVLENNGKALVRPSEAEMLKLCETY